MDDLVKRLSGIADVLTDLFPEFSKDINAAADRIEQLEAALQGIFEEADGDFPDIGDIRFTARVALREKKDD